MLHNNTLVLSLPHCVVYKVVVCIFTNSFIKLQFDQESYQATSSTLCPTNSDPVSPNININFYIHDYKLVSNNINLWFAHSN